MKTKKIFFSISTLTFILIALSVYMPIKAEKPIPFDVYHIVPTNNILYPRLGTPIFVSWNDKADIYVLPLEDDFKLDGWSVYLINKISGISYQLDINNINEIIDDRSESAIEKYLCIQVNIPRNIPRGLYNLRLVRSRVYEEPNAVFVFGEKYPEEIRIAHISDNHLGEFYKPKYMKENKYFLRAIATIESLNIDIIVVTGDFVDGVLKEDFHKYVYHLLSTLNVPIIVTTGNTDYYLMEKNSWLWEKYYAPNSAVTAINNIIILPINARNGDIPEETANWIESVLSYYRDKTIKVWLSHYPHWDESSTSDHLRELMAKWNKDYGLNLALHGHIHRDDVRVAKATNILTIVSTSTATSKQYRGFRIVRLYMNGDIKYDESSISIQDNYVEFSQINDYTSHAQTITIKMSSLKNTKLRIIAKLKDLGYNVTIIDANKLSEYTSDIGRTVLLEVSDVTDKIIKVYQVEDKKPPKIEIKVAATPSEVNIKPVVTDDGLGVKDIRVYYSFDNKTWEEINPVLEDEVKFFVMQTPKVNYLYIKVIAEDYAGLASEAYTVEELGLGAEEVVETEQLQFPVEYVVVIIIIVVIALIGIWRMRR